MKKIMVLFMSLILVFLWAQSVKAASFTLTYNDTIIQIDIIDPVSYSSEGVTFIETNNDIVIYTALWHYTHASFEDMTFITFNQAYEVTKIEQDEAYIPLDGFVLALPNNHPLSSIILVGDHMVPSNTTTIRFFTRAIESTQGVRSVITGENIPRSSQAMVLYDSSYADTTNTSRLGSEMTITFDETKQTYHVSHFRAPGAGPSEGSPIPNDGFVLSGAGMPFQFYLIEGYKFTHGEEIHFMDLSILKSETFTYHLNDTNPTLETNPDGVNAGAYRGANQLIKYTYEWEQKTSAGLTNTNAFGYEVAVNSEGIVIALGTHVVIPQDGYVLSGNGEAAAFLRNHVYLGSMASIHEDTVTINNQTTAIALIHVEHAYAKANEDYHMRLDGLYAIDFDGAKNSLEAIETLMEEIRLNYEHFNQEEDDQAKMRYGFMIRKLYQSIDQKILELKLALLPSYQIEARALWHRPNERTLEDIIKHLDLWESLGYNLVYVETLWTGYTNYPSNYIDMHPALDGATFGEHGTDYLKAFIEEAHKRNIEVHAWNEIFFMGSTARPLSNVLRDNPSWHMLNLDGSNIQNTTLFADPANLEFRQFLVDYHVELFTNYDLDGMEFDYIRYPYLDANHPSGVRDSGYTDVAIERFMSLHDLEGDLKTLVIEDASVKLLFDQFRRDQVTDTLFAIREAVLNVNPNAQISMAIAPDHHGARNNYLQEWPKWVENGWIDHISPMIYHYDKDFVGNRIATIQGIIGNKSFQYSGIAPVYYGYSVYSNQEQMLEANLRGAFGSAMFASHNLNESFINAIVLSTARTKAVLPHANLEIVLAKAIEEQRYKIETIYEPAGAVNSEHIDQLYTVFNQLLTLELSHAKDYQVLYTQIQILNAYSDLYFEGAAKNRFEEDTSRLMAIIDIHISRDLIGRGFWNPATMQERPDASSFDYPVIPGDDGLDEPSTTGPKFGLLLTGSIFISTLALGASGYFLKKKFFTN
ncbi:MAG: glycoside hydrolase family 10 protein [Candidatus Izemoplasmataceae bacterium]